MKTIQPNKGTSEISHEQIVEFMKNNPWLTGTSEIKRAFAVLGYALAAYALVGIGLVGLVALSTLAP